MNTRPTKYATGLALRIAARLANDERLETVCLDADMPDIASVSEWLSSGRHRDFEDMFCWAQERRDTHTYAEERWGPYPRTLVSPPDVPILMQHFVMTRLETRQFYYVDDGADLERKIRTRRFRFSVINGGRAQLWFLLQHLSWPMLIPKLSSN